VFQPQSFLYDHDAEHGVVTLTLNRPNRLNALTFEVYDELRRTFDALSEEEGVRVIVITGSGRAFCSGSDVEDIIGALFERDYRGLLDFTRMTGDFISAAEAERIGLYNRVVPDGEALTAAMALAQKLSKGPSFALEITKDALNREAAMDLPAALEAEAQIQASLMLHPDFRESYQAFVEKREARFL
jgi:enoyl-CoA hydratase/carnithine racemase